MANKLLVAGAVIAAGGILGYMWYKKNHPAATQSATTMTSGSSPAAARQFAQQWAAGHGDANWVAAVNDMSDGEAVVLAGLLQTYLTGPNAPGTYAMNGTDGENWVYLTQKYHVS